MYRPSLFLSLTSEVSINLSSAWYGIALVTPGFSSPMATVQNLWLLTESVLFGTLFFVIAYWLRQHHQKT